MKIRDIKTTVIQGWVDWLIIRVETDEGVYGYGEAPMPAGHVVETYKSLINGSIKPQLIGEDPTNVEKLYRKMGPSPRGGVQNYVISSVEMALWDIAGKTLDAPIHKLLGGKLRDKVRVYADCHAGEPTKSRESYDVTKNRAIFTPEAYARHAGKVKNLGYTFLKFDLYPKVASLADPNGLIDGHLNNAGVKYFSSILEAIRKEIGYETDLAIDFSYGGTYNIADAIKLLNALERYDLKWAEDILTPDNIDAWAMLTRSVKTPTLLGGVIQTRWGFREIIEKQAVRILHPDLTHCGGLSEGKKIADMAELYYMSVAVHNICSPIGTMAAVHTASVMPNFLALEIHHLGVPWWNDLVKGKKPIIDHGYIEVPDDAGLGIELDEAEMKKHLKLGENFFGR